MTCLLQEAGGHLLIDDIVLGQKDTQATALIRLWPRGGNRGDAFFALFTQRRSDGLKKGILLHRFGQVSPDSQLAATGRVPCRAGGGQHDDNGPGQIGILPQLGGYAEAVNVRHLGVEEKKVIMIAGQLSCPQHA